MTGSVNRGALRTLLKDNYSDLKRRLARRLGSLDVASDVLHETYLRLERFDGLVPVANPQAYLLRMALNVASDHEQARKRWLTAVELDDLWRLGDDVIDPETIVVSRSELALFKAALSELSPRIQAILIAARVDRLPHEVIAKRFDISTRMVQFELRHALAHCAERLERKIVRRFGPSPANPSKLERRSGVR
jgi:RNA polymerase sigma factor (sigma-70 family)